MTSVLEKAGCEHIKTIGKIDFDIYGCGRDKDSFEGCVKWL
jgi:hypothetical protein